MALETWSHVGLREVYLQEAHQILEPLLSLAHVAWLREEGIQIVSVGMCSVASGVDSVPMLLNPCLTLPCAPL